MELSGGVVGQVGNHATPASIGVLGAGQGQLFGGTTVGDRLLQSGFNVNALRTCAQEIGRDPTGFPVYASGSLLDREWKYFDNIIQQVARERLPVAQLLLSKGLNYPLPNALGVMTLEWQRVVGDLGAAELTMTGLPDATADRLQWETVNMPIPIIHKEFYYNIRHLEAARRNGRNLDASHAQVATRKVAEMIEQLIFTGVTIGGQTIYGLITEPNRKTASVTASWATTTGDNMVADTIRAIDTLTNSSNNFEGPFWVFVPQTVAANMGNDFKAYSSMTIMQRLMQIPGVAGITPTARLTGTQIVFVQLTSDVIEMVNGMAPTMVEWDSHGGFQKNFKIISIMVPRVRSDGWQQSGILQLS